MAMALGLIDFEQPEGLKAAEGATAASALSHLWTGSARLGKSRSLVCWEELARDTIASFGAESGAARR